MSLSRGLLALAASITLVTSAFAQQPAAKGATESLTLELNNARQSEDICRLSFMIGNQLGTTLEDIGLEVVLLDKNGLAQDFLLLRSGRLTEGKRRIRQFDLQGVSCTDLGEILVNDVSDCQGTGLDANLCLDALSTSSRAGIKLGV